VAAAEAQRPPGTFTQAEYAAQHRLKTTTAKQRINRMLRMGVIVIRGRGTQYTRSRTGRIHAHQVYYYEVAEPWRDPPPSGT
jgi:hypothetical protein